MKDIETLGSVNPDSALATNKLVRNTYLLLSLTLLLSAGMAALSLAAGLGRGSAMVLMLVSFGLIFWVQKTANTAQGLLAIFVFAGCMGAALGPMLAVYLHMHNGPMLVMEALAATSLVFFSLSAYALISRRDFSFMGGFLMTGLVVVVVAMFANMFLHIPLLGLVLPAVVVVLMSGLILFDTSRIVRGGETSYIRATLSLYLNFYNLFISILQLLGSSQRR